MKWIHATYGRDRRVCAWDKSGLYLVRKHQLHSLPQGFQVSVLSGTFNYRKDSDLKISAFIFYDCFNKFLKTVWLQTVHIYSLSVLKVKCPWSVQWVHIKVVTTLLPPKTLGNIFCLALSRFQSHVPCMPWFKATSSFIPRGHMLLIFIFS